MKNRALPENIHVHRGGLRVRVQRGGKVREAFVPAGRDAGAPGGEPAGLDRALQLREELRRAAGPAIRPKRGRPHQVAYSNTGLPGISETVNWCRNKPRECFVVSWSRDGQATNRKVLYGWMRTRRAALRAAIALRNRMTGQKLQMPEEVLD